jgi:hypothetical protein
MIAATAVTRPATTRTAATGAEGAGAEEVPAEGVADVEVRAGLVRVAAAVRGWVDCCMPVSVASWPVS